MRRGATVRYAILLMAGASLCACASVHPEYSAHQPTHRARTDAAPRYKVGSPYEVGGIWYVPKEQPDYNQTGTASWYGDAFHLKPTANGEIFDKDIASAAHTTLPLPSLVEVTNLDNGRRLTVRVNDRGPFVDNRIIDLSHEAARQLGYDRQGLAHVRVRYLGPAPLYGEETRRYAYLAPKPAPAAAAPPPPPPRREPEVVLTSAPLPKAPEPIVEATLAPLPKVMAVATQPMAAVAAPKIEVAAGAFRVQAGAFSTPENAQRAVAQLAAAGMARVEPLARGGTTLYRVVLDGAADQDSAELLREKVAEAGFADARVIRPF
ncbi:MAG: rare lipoprotein [Phenylobacterium sp.]|nr:rare lipoprotein [Phenylobacterium sp.]